MTIEEAIKMLKQWNEDLLPYEDEKEGIECHNIAISALEKQIPKNPIEDDYYDEPAVCPNCGGNVINMADNDYHFQHCHYCGQALKWRDSDDS